MQRNSNLISRDLRISNCAVMGVAHPQDNPGDLISLVPQHCGTGRAIDTTRKRNQNLVFIHSLPLSSHRFPENFLDSATAIWSQRSFCG